MKVRRIITAFQACAGAALIMSRRAAEGFSPHGTPDCVALPFRSTILRFLFTGFFHCCPVKFKVESL
jgi:hypothetical protein